MESEAIQKILLDQGYVEQQDVEAAQEFELSGAGSALDYLVQQELITKDLFGQAIAEHYGVPYADLNSNMPTQDQVVLIPVSIGQQYRAVVFERGKKQIVVTTDNPQQDGLQEQLKNIFEGMKVSLAYSLSEDIDQVLQEYHTSLNTRFAEIIEQEERVAPEIIHEIVLDALRLRASDIHFEPQNKEVVIRFRVDGVLQEAGRVKKQYYDNILNRIKVQAHMRIDEHFSAQDGAIRLEEDAEHGEIDMRVSVTPILDGEKVVIRLLSQYVQQFTLADIGLSPENQEILQRAIHKPFGMMVVTGPTGSGKTTTLYSVLKRVNNPHVNITTIEDPVEYRITGVNQIQVNKQTNLSFAEGLRSIVRQDPDIILVGEIRDTETAEIAVNAALTGHLMLSTFHANDSATAIPRMLDMGVEPFLLASTLELVVAQRLVRKICENCRVSYTPTLAELKEQFSSPRKFFSAKDRLYYGKGCTNCHQTGYVGRTAIYEFIELTPELKELILQNPSTQDIWKIARASGAKTLFEDGIEKVKSGVTTIDELLRVSAPPQDV